MKKPDLSTANQEIIQYIEYLEKRLGISPKPEIDLRDDRLSEIISTEPPTSYCLITISDQGAAKRSYRHLYNRQHRGGMGVFDLEVSVPDYPAVLGLADESQSILLLTNHARAFRYPVQQLPSEPIHSRGTPAFERMNFEVDEKITAFLPIQAKGYVALLGQTGKVRLLRHHLFGEHMKQGTMMFNPGEFGPLVSACWTSGDGELFIVSKNGMGIRFPEKSISPQGDLGLRLGIDDTAVGISSVADGLGLFILGSDGRGTIRSLSGFAANKSAGGSGKIAIKNDDVIGAVNVQSGEDLFIITLTGKMIRFCVDEVPVTDGPVQGVICISMRADKVSAFSRNIIE
jgi:DNA gyrase subunit A